MKLKRRKVIQYILCGVLLLANLTGCGGTIMNSPVIQQTETTESRTESSSEIHENREAENNSPFGTVKRNPEAAKRKNIEKYMILQQSAYFMEQTEDGLEIDIPHVDEAIAEKLEEQILQEYERISQEEPKFQGCKIYDKMYPIRSTDVWCSSSTAWNNVMSVRFMKSYEYKVSQDQIAEYFYEEYWQNYNLKTGELMKLKDLFYEDTDYVSLLNDMIYAWEVKQRDFGEDRFFEGIQENQTFYLDFEGWLHIKLTEEKEFMIDPIRFVEISAIQDAAGKELLLDEYANQYLCTNYSISEIGRDIVPNYHDMEGFDEQIIYLKRAAVSDDLMEKIENHPVMAADYMEDENVLLMREMLEGCEYYFKKYISVNQVGPYYRVSANQEFETADMPEEVWERVADIWNELYYKSAARSIYFDANGEEITYRNLFREDVDADEVIANGILAFWNNLELSQEEWDEYYGCEKSKESALALVQNSEVLISDHGLWVNSFEMNVYGDVDWEYLLPYLK